MKTVITLHASNTPPDVDLGRRELDIRDRKKNYAEIGYHYVIRRDGTIETGRTLKSASVFDEVRIARESISVCLIGGVDDRREPINNFTREQRDALIDLAHDLRQRHPIERVVNVCPALQQESQDFLPR